MRVEIVPVTQAAIETVAANMRDEDVIEVAFFGKTPLESLEYSVAVSEFASVIEVNGEPVTILGLRRLGGLSDTGVPWLLSSNNALKYRKLFISLVDNVVGDMLNECSKLVNYVHEGNRVSMRWLKRVGFTITDDYVIVGGGKFYKFYKECRNV